MKLQAVVSALLLHVSLTGAAKFEQYILAPDSRTVVPASVYKVNGSVVGPQALISGGSRKKAKFQDISAVTYDFGKNTAGIVSFNVSQVTGKNQFIGAGVGLEQVPVQLRQEEKGAEIIVRESLNPFDGGCFPGKQRPAETVAGGDEVPKDKIVGPNCIIAVTQGHSDVVIIRRQKGAIT